MSLCNLNIKDEKENLEYNWFEEYPHYVYATAFLANNMLADYKIGNQEKSWHTRTFRGSFVDREILNNSEKYVLTTKYKKILVNNDKEHNQAFEILEKWVNTFEKIVVKVKKD